MMRSPRLTGPGAGVEKYDLLTALSVAGLSGSGPGQTSILRLIAVITARYNWAQDELSMGHREMAALWSVDERTAKRETKRLIEAGILAQKRKGARGRVSAYRLCTEAIFALSEPLWTQVGPDFSARMAERQPEAAKVVKVDFSPRPRGPDPRWEAVLETLSQSNPARVAAWYGKLRPLSCDEGLLRIEAQSSFVLRYIQTHLMADLGRALQAAYPDLRRVEFVEAENRH